MYRIDINPNHHAGDLRNYDGSEANSWDLTKGTSASGRKYRYINGDKKLPDLCLDPFNVLLIKQSIAEIIQDIVPINWELLDVIVPGGVEYKIANILECIPTSVDIYQMPIPKVKMQGKGLMVSSVQDPGPALFADDKFLNIYKKFKWSGIIPTDVKIG